MNAADKRGVPYLRWSRGTLLFPADRVQAVLAEIEAAGGTIVGMEAFELAGNALHPRIDLIYDASRNRSSARDVLSTWDESVWIDLTLGD
jgi:hypothetical protein